MITQIVAVSENHALGKDNKLLWHYPVDLKYFKDMTLNKVMIMGRKTFESFPKPLPKRYHVVISSQPHTSENPSVIYVKSIEEAIAQARSLINSHQLESEIMVIGGAQIYKNTLSISDKLLITRIPGVYEADTFYPTEYTGLFRKTSEQYSSESKLIFETWVKN